jgi:hypothetical protein
MCAEMYTMCNVQSAFVRSSRYGHVSAAFTIWAAVNAAVTERCGPKAGQLGIAVAAAHSASGASFDGKPILRPKSRCVPDIRDIHDASRAQLGNSYTAHFHIKSPDSSERHQGFVYRPFLTCVNVPKWADADQPETPLSNSGSINCSWQFKEPRCSMQAPAVIPVQRCTNETLSPDSECMCRSPRSSYRDRDRLSRCLGGTQGR